MSVRFIYFMRRADGVGPIRIGHTANPDRRLWEANAFSPYPLAIIGLCAVEERFNRRDAFLAEQRLHARHAAARIHRDWFEPTAELLRDIEALPESLATVVLPSPQAERAA